MLASIMLNQSISQFKEEKYLSKKKKKEKIKPALQQNAFQLL